MKQKGSGEGRINKLDRSLRGKHRSKVLWKTEAKNNHSSEYPFSINWEVRNKSWDIKDHSYNGEFDPGSGWTLAAGLIHASCTGFRVAIPGWE